MINKSTVFVLGAGASAPYGYPTGTKLLADVTALLRADDERVSMLQEACECDVGRLRQLADSLERAAPDSIDRFLESRPDLIDLGKAAIATILIPCERESELFTPWSDVRQPGRWYSYVLDRMGAKADEFKQNRLVILTFNYDRSLDHFFMSALEQRFHLGPAQVAPLIHEAMPIVHLHGRLGPVPYLDLAAPANRKYQPDLTPAGIKMAAEAISVIHEPIDYYSQFKEAREHLRDAEEIFFLGFGYHPLNIKRLGPQNFNKGKRSTFYMAGTAYGLLDIDMRDAQGAIGEDPRPQFAPASEDVLTFLRRRWA